MLNRKKESGRVGEWESGRVESGRVGEWESGRVGEINFIPSGIFDRHLRLYLHANMNVVV